MGWPRPGSQPPAFWYHRVIHRRIAALLIALASLHLPVGAAAATCGDAVGTHRVADGEDVAAHGASHGEAGMAAEALPSDGGESWGAAGSPPGEEHSCGTGGGASCCAGMTNCTATVALAEPGRASRAAPNVDRASAAPIAVPLSFHPTLEPPPPKR